MKLTERVIETTGYHGKTGTAHYLWDGRQRFHTVGRFGELTLHEARTEALEKLAKIRRGADP